MGLEMFGKSNVPSKRYPIWIDAFSNMVTEAQNQIKQAEKLQLPYLCVKEVLDDMNLPHDINIKLQSECIFIDLIPQKDDRLSLYDEIMTKIAAKAVKRKIRSGNKEQPSAQRRALCSPSYTSCIVTQIGDDCQYIQFTVRFDPYFLNGYTYIDFKKEERQDVSCIYTVCAK